MQLGVLLAVTAAIIGWLGIITSTVWTLRSGFQVMAGIKRPDEIYIGRSVTQVGLIISTALWLSGIVVFILLRTGVL